MERFELSQALTPLPLFESGPFNHLGTSPCLSQHQLLPGKRGELMGRTKKIMILYIPQKPCNIKDFAVKTYQITSSISSQTCYDRLRCPKFVARSCSPNFDRCRPCYSLYLPQAALANDPASIPLRMYCTAFAVTTLCIF